MRKRLTQFVARHLGETLRFPQMALRLIFIPLLAAPTVATWAASEPTPSWIALHNGAGRSYDYGNAVATDGAGNVYVTGSADDDYVTIKYGPDGVVKWTARYDGPGHGTDNPVAIAVNAVGEVYVTGSSYGGATRSGGTDYDLATVKYSASGVEQWAERFNGSGNQGDAARSLALGPDGSIYVTGYSYEAVSAWDFITLKYDANGQLRWSVGYDNDFGADRAAAVATDPQGNVYVVGESWGGQSGFDYVTLSYTSDGDRRWIDRYNGPQNGTETPTAITAAADGTCWVTGTSTGIYNTDVATLRYDGSGARMWTARFNGTGNGPDIGQALTVDAAGNSYVAGMSQGTRTGSDYLTLKYGPSGVQLWSATYDGAGGNDQATAVAVRNSKVYVTGQSTHAASGSGFATLCYSATGSSLWAARYEGLVVNAAGATGLALGADGSLCVVGSAWSAAGGLDFATLRYPAPAPAAPSSLTAIATDAGAQLAWSHPGEDATGFIIERKAGDGVFGMLAAVGLTPASYLDEQVTAGVTYAYRVRATGPGGDSELSNVATLRVPGGVPGKISVNAKKVNFGTVPVGKSKLKKVTIKNTGKGTLSGVVQLDAGPFTLSGGVGTFSLAPKKSATFTVSFAPATAGVAAGTLRVQSDDPARPLIVVPLSGKGK